MNTIPDKNKDQLRKLFNSDQLEKPGSHFTENVMKQLGIAPSVQSVQVKPIIPLFGWIIIAITTLTIFIMALSESSDSTFRISEMITGTVINHAGSYMESVLHSKLLLYAAMLSVAIFLLFCFDSWYRGRLFRQANV